MDTADWDVCYFLSLGGTSPLALLHFLKTHPQVDSVRLYLDNDKAGLEGMVKIEAAINAGEALSVQVRAITAEPPPKERGKDYNQVLQSRLGNLKGA